MNGVVTHMEMSQQIHMHINQRLSLGRFVVAFGSMAPRNAVLRTVGGISHATVGTVSVFVFAGI